jgi:AraC-like DNA-binding protein
MNETARGLGFADHSHFTRTFRRFVGVVPNWTGSGPLGRITALLSPEHTGGSRSLTEEMIMSQQGNRPKLTERGLADAQQLCRRADRSSATDAIWRRQHESPGHHQPQHRSGGRTSLFHAVARRAMTGASPCVSASGAPMSHLEWHGTAAADGKIWRGRADRPPHEPRRHPDDRAGHESWGGRVSDQAIRRPGSARRNHTCQRYGGATEELRERLIAAVRSAADDISADLELPSTSARFLASAV